MEWDGYMWLTSTEIDDKRLTDDPIEVYFSRVEEDETSLTPDEIAMINAAGDRLDATIRAAVEALFEAYPGLQESYPYDDTDRAEFMPDLDSIDDLYPLIGMGEVSIHGVIRDGSLYVGVVFNAEWDVEHGAGVMMNGDRVVEVGLADTAILTWIATRDAESA